MPCGSSPVPTRPEVKDHTAPTAFLMILVIHVRMLRRHVLGIEDATTGRELLGPLGRLRGTALWGGLRGIASRHRRWQVVPREARDAVEALRAHRGRASRRALSPGAPGGVGGGAESVAGAVVARAKEVLRAAAVPHHEAPLQRGPAGGLAVVVVPADRLVLLQAVGEEGPVAVAALDKLLVIGDINVCRGPRGRHNGGLRLKRDLVQVRGRGGSVVLHCGGFDAEIGGLERWVEGSGGALLVPDLGIRVHVVDVLRCDEKRGSTALPR